MREKIIYGSEITKIINLEERELKQWCSPQLNCTNDKCLTVVCESLEDAQGLFKILRGESFRWGGGEKLNLEVCGIDSSNLYPQHFEIDIKPKLVRHGHGYPDYKYFVYRGREYDISFGDIGDFLTILGGEKNDNI